jgi:hypothetical protein
MVRGRKADKGTYEARENIVLICNKISMINELSNDAQERVIKALKFGLGIKEEEKTINKINNVIQKVMIKEEKKIITPIKEKKVTKNQNLSEGDEYFKPEDCKEVGY